jgi:hypothetical protein
MGGAVGLGAGLDIWTRENLLFVLGVEPQIIQFVVQSANQLLPTRTLWITHTTDEIMGKVNTRTLTTKHGKGTNPVNNVATVQEQDIGNRRGRWNENLKV